jgi:hypothetical protein
VRRFVTEMSLKLSLPGVVVETLVVSCSPLYAVQHEIDALCKLPAEFFLPHSGGWTPSTSETCHAE